MKTYLVQYKHNDSWVPFVIVANDMYEAHDWATKHIQPTGVSTQLYNAG